MPWRCWPGHWGLGPARGTTNDHIRGGTGSGSKPPRGLKRQLRATRPLGPSAAWGLAQACPAFAGTGDPFPPSHTGERGATLVRVGARTSQAPPPWTFRKPYCCPLPVGFSPGSIGLGAPLCPPSWISQTHCCPGLGRMAPGSLFLSRGPSRQPGSCEGSVCHLCGSPAWSGGT